MLPVLNISDTSLFEGDTGTNQAVFVVTLWPPATNTVDVSFLTANGTAVGSGSQRDFFPVSGKLSFPPGTTNLSIVVGVRGDTSYETDEVFLARIYTPVNATIGDGEAQCTIRNDDGLPSFQFET